MSNIRVVTLMLATETYEFVKDRNTGKTLLVNQRPVIEAEDRYETFYYDEADQKIVDVSVIEDLEAQISAAQSA